MNESRKPESMSEAAGRSAAVLTTRLIEAHNRVPYMERQIDPVALQSALALAFEQGANWAMDQAIEIVMTTGAPANRRAI